MHHEADVAALRQWDASRGVAAARPGRTPSPARDGDHRRGKACEGGTVNAPYATDRAGPTKQARHEVGRAGKRLGLQTPWLEQGCVGNGDDAGDETKREEEEATAALLRPFWCLMELSIQTREDKTAGRE
ncbi:hypothetical protein TgHK011_005993 [Trichoderma gracile]|nr:hypothetical protein TgHK011_005993 [Trichoderma gracile]